MENTVYGESSMEGGGMGGPSGNAPFDGEPSGESSDANGDRPTPPDAK